MKVVIMEDLGIPAAELAALEEPFVRAGVEFAAYPRSGDVGTMIAQARDAEAMILANMPMPGKVLRACPRLQFIDVAFTGVDHVDLAAARELGCAVSNASGYSTEAVAEIVKDMDPEETGGELTYPVFDESDHLEQPNILLIQLESFFDVNTIIGSEYSADPTPTFNRLCRNFPSGLLYVPTIGGGTANTEFEVLTGLDLDFFGAGELPYNTIMQQTAVETINFDLKEHGYTATAIHSNGATFYSRNLVYPNMGFDRFVSLEYMQDMKYTSLGWAREAELTREVLRALETTEGRDVVMCISVESHGKYAEEYTPEEGDIEVLAVPETVPPAFMKSRKYF